MVERRRWVALAVAAGLSLTGAMPATAASPQVYTTTSPNRFVTGWIPYWTAQSGSAVLTGTTSAPLVSEVSVMGYSQDLVAQSSNVATIANATRAAGLPLIPTIYGTRTDVFSSTATRYVHADKIVDLVKKNGFDGIDIDYEFVFSVPRSTWAALQPQWVDFVKYLGTKLHAAGKVLSVTVPPVWNSGSSGYTVYAQSTIAPYVDRLRLMVYDWSISSPGNIAPSTWVNSVISYSTDTAKVPPKKLQLGVPTYGRHWWTKKVSTETCPDGSLQKVQAVRQNALAGLLSGKVLTSKGRVNGEMKYTWDEKVTGLSKLPPDYVPVVGSLFGLLGPASTTGLVPAVRLGVPRTVTCTIQHVVYIPDASTIVTNAKSALARGWSGIAVWTFGYETSALWSALNNSDPTTGIAPQRATGGPVVKNGAVTYAAGAVRAQGTAYHPQWDLPVAVRIDVKQGATVLATRTVTANRTATAPTGVGPFHGYDQTIGALTLAPGSYTVCATQLRWGGGDLVADCDPLVVA